MISTNDATLQNIRRIQSYQTTDLGVLKNHYSYVKKKTWVRIIMIDYMESQKEWIVNAND